MITIRPSATADTRTCDFANVSKETLFASSVQHIGDVRAALMYFSGLLDRAASVHDLDKLADIDGFHSDFLTGFARTEWWDRHRKLNRHHLTKDDFVLAVINAIGDISKEEACAAIVRAGVEAEADAGGVGGPDGGGLETQAGQRQMSVYVDNMRAAYGRMTMCHMVADSTAELLAMADRIGVDRKWLQDAGTSREHFDIALSKRRLALEAGAKEVTMRELATLLLARKPASQMAADWKLKQGNDR